MPQEALFLPEGSTVQDNLDVADVATPEECKPCLNLSACRALLRNEEVWPPVSMCRVSALDSNSCSHLAESFSDAPFENANLSCCAAGRHSASRSELKRRSRDGAHHAGYYYDQVQELHGDSSQPLIELDYKLWQGGSHRYRRHCGGGQASRADAKYWNQIW